MLDFPYNRHGLRSHIHPHFVIYNTGRKLKHKDNLEKFNESCQKMENKDALMESLDSILTIYCGWMALH